MTSLRSPGLLGRMALALASVALLPLLVSFYQLRANRDALLEQVQRTHLVAATTTADRIAARLGSLRSLGLGLLENPVFYEDPRSPGAQELLRGSVLARDDLAAAGVFLKSGETVVLARKSGLEDELAGVLGAPFEPGLERRLGKERRWLRWQWEFEDHDAFLVLASSMEPIEALVRAPELGRDAVLTLADRSGRVLHGTGSLEELPPEVVALAKSDAVTSGAQKLRFEDREDLVVAYSLVTDSPFFVLSQQSARVAETAVARIRRATAITAALSALLTALLSLLAWDSVVKPIREILQTRRRLAGLSGPLPGGSEIGQLKEAFEELERRVRDRAEIGDVFLGRYQVVEVLGTGAMGTVFRGWDPRLKRGLAIKTVRLSGVVFDRERLTQQLMDEAETYARFNHPNIVTVHDVAGTEDAAFVVMELVDGASLDACLEEHGRLPADQVVVLGLAIAEALAEAHELKVIHHDIKPANVLIGRDGTIKVGDFGISRLLSEAVEGDGRVCGTPGYLPPESLELAIYTPKSDLFSLGALLYRCLTGESAFQGHTVDEISFNTVAGNRKSLSAYGIEAPEALVDLVEDLLATSPDRRPSSARKVADRLQQLATRHGYRWRTDCLPTKPGPPTHSQAQFVPLTLSRSDEEPTLPPSRNDG